MRRWGRALGQERIPLIGSRRLLRACFRHGSHGMPRAAPNARDALALGVPGKQAWLADG